MAKWIEKIQDSLTPDLLKKEYKNQNKDNPLFGHLFKSFRISIIFIDF